ncbi:MAG: hypothetical protein HOW97_25490 [Catenulispora sp.]|nr:hypothetical protein [Catenulispora sp.]
MSSKFSRKPVAVAAILASSIGSALAAGGAAHATTYGEPTSPVTVTANGAINVVGGAKIALPAGAHDVSWAGQGGRFAYIGADNAIYTADFDGTHAIKIGQGVAPSHTVWDAFNTYVYWTEGTGNSAKIVGAYANGDSMSSDAAVKTFDVITPPAGVGVSSADVAADRNNSVVVQTTDATGDTGISVATWDTTGQHLTVVVAPGDAKTGGSTPTISPDGKSVVFVRTDAAGDKQLFASTFANNAWSTPKQISWLTGDHTTPVFEADNLHQTVAFEYKNRTTPSGTAKDGTYQVVLADALAATAPGTGLEKSVSDLSGGLAVRTDNKGMVFRLAGWDRTDTAVLTSHQQWRTAGAPTTDTRPQAQSVTLSRSDAFADALGGSALAAHKAGPLLLTDTKTLSSETQTEIQRVLPKGGTVHVLGGTAAISPAVEAKLKALGYTVDRIAGSDRFETSVKIADAIDPNAKFVLVATGTKFPDALSAGAAAGTYDSTVVVLSDGDTLPKVTNDYLRHKASVGVGVAAIGGAADHAMKAAGYRGFDSLVGATRYETSYLVARDIFGSFGTIGVATGENWPDSLAGGALMGLRGGPLLLVDPAPNTGGLTADENALIDSNRGAANWAFIFGGPNALPLTVDKQLADDIGTASGTGNAPIHPAAKTPNLSTPHFTQG